MIETRNQQALAFYDEVANKVASDIKVKGSSEIDFGDKDLSLLMQAGVAMALQNDVAKKVGLNIEIPRSEISWQEKGVGYSGTAKISLGSKIFNVEVNCLLVNDDSSGSDSVLKLSEETGPIISFNNPDDAVKASDLFSLIGMDLRTLNQEVRKGFSNPAKFLFEGVKEALQPNDPDKPAILDRKIILNPKSVRAFVTPNHILKLAVSKS